MMEVRETTLTAMRPFGGSAELNALKEVIEGGWWGKGPKVAKFEEEFAQMVGAKYAIAVTSNTNGLDLILKAKGIQNCDVLSPTISFVTTGIVPIWNQCKSILCDADPYTLNIDPNDVKNQLTLNTKAIIAVNYAGVPADIDSIRNHYNGFIIEDCALSCYTPGAGLKGDVAVWSFQAVKTISSGDGGMITTDNETLYEKIRPMTNFGISLSTYDRSKQIKNVSKEVGYVWDYEVNSIGYKAYMNDIQAALCLAQLKRINDFLKIRRHVQKRYNKELEQYITIPAWTETAQFYSARVGKEHRAPLIEYLASKKIHTAVHFKPLHLHSVLKQDRKFPVADEEWLKLISLPCHASMTDYDIDYVIYWIKEFFANK